MLILKERERFLRFLRFLNLGKRLPFILELLVKREKER